MEYGLEFEHLEFLTTTFFERTACGCGSGSTREVMNGKYVVEKNVPDGYDVPLKLVHRICDSYSR
jgi:hypothetical protein